MARRFPDWRALANCAALSQAEVDRLFFNDRTPNEAQRLCQTCPVLRECREDADALEAGYRGDRSHQVGFWAGETSAQRRQRRARAAMPVQ